MLGTQQFLGDEAGTHCVVRGVVSRAIYRVIKCSWFTVDAWDIYSDTPQPKLTQGAACTAPELRLSERRCLNAKTVPCLWQEYHCFHIVMFKIGISQWFDSLCVHALVEKIMDWKAVFNGWPAGMGGPCFQRKHYKIIGCRVAAL